MFNFLDSNILPEKLDNEAFIANHNLNKTEVLSIDSLSQIIPSLPKEQVMFSKGLADLNENFDRAHIDKKNNLSLKETIEQLKTHSSYIMVRSPETSPALQSTFQGLKDDVSKLCDRKGIGTELYEPMLYLFIASPSVKTPFHIDRYSTLLFQLRGSKTIAVYEQFNDKVVPAVVRESFVDHSELRPSWKNETDHLAQKFEFTPGQMLHIPFIAPHYVENGHQDISISLSIIFRTNESQNWLKAMTVNNRLRSKLKLNPSPIGNNSGNIKLKAKCSPFVTRIIR